MQLLSNEASSLSGYEKDSEGGLFNLLKNGAMYVIGGIIFSWLLSIAIEILKPLLYMLQSLAIFATIMSMSMTLLFGGFRPDVVIKHGAFLMSIMLLPIFWHAADYINEHLLKILYPQYQSGVVAVVLNEGVVAVIYFIFLLLAYIALPGYFIKLMGQAGAEAADVAGDAMKASREIVDKGAAGAARGLGGIKFKK